MTDAAVLTRMLHGIDTLDWPSVRASFTDEVYTDYTSLWGGEAGVTSLDDLIAEWTDFITEFGASQHLTGPVIVDGERLSTHVVAHHWRADGTCWVVYGHYLARLSSDGRIAELVLQTFHASGVADLPNIPSKRPE